jgi:hypothetical protein
MGIILAILGEMRRVYGLYRDLILRISRSPGFPVENSTKSYWMEPPSKIARHQSTFNEENLVFDVAILGSGISGLSVARTLLEDKEHGEKDGFRILMLEAREACSGATGRYV